MGHIILFLYPKIPNTCSSQLLQINEQLQPLSLQQTINAC